jgi:hypothetical protein
MTKMICTIILAMLSIAVRGEQKPSQAGPPAPPEVKQTVDALDGIWTGEMTARIPGNRPATFAWRMECKTVALGAGVACTNGGIASIGQMSESCLFAFDPDGKAVHYMCVTSMGEVHDHKGHWKDGRRIEFEPLRAGMMGSQVIETLRWQFSGANSLDKFSIVTMADGTEMIFEFKGKRE